MYYAAGLLIAAMVFQGGERGHFSLRRLGFRMIAMIFFNIAMWPAIVVIAAFGPLFARVRRRYVEA